MTRKATGKRPALEGPSQKRKSVDPLGRGGPLIIDDDDISWKRHRVVAGLIDNKKDEDEIPLARRQRA
jgi:hypothetical protein